MMVKIYVTISGGYYEKTIISCPSSITRFEWHEHTSKQYSQKSMGILQDKSLSEN